MPNINSYKCSKHDRENCFECSYQCEQIIDPIATTTFTEPPPLIIGELRDNIARFVATEIDIACIRQSKHSGRKSRKDKTYDKSIERVVRKLRTRYLLSE